MLNIFSYLAKTEVKTETENGDYNFGNNSKQQSKPNFEVKDENNPEKGEAGKTPPSKTPSSHPPKVVFLYTLDTLS